MSLISTPTPGISALLNQARFVVLEELSGQPATIAMLALAARILKRAVLVQAAAGLWREFGIQGADDLAELDARVGFGNTMLGEPPLKIEWNFSRTKLPLLVVECVKPEAAS